MMNKFFKIFKKQIVVEDEIVTEIIVKEPTICDIIKEKSGEDWSLSEKWNDFFICISYQDVDPSSRGFTKHYTYDRFHTTLKLFNGLGEPISDNFRKIEYNCSKFLIVGGEYGYNIINSHGKYVFDINFKSLDYLKKFNTIRCQLDNEKFNVLDEDLNLIFDKWYNIIYTTGFKDVYEVFGNKKWFLLKKDNTYLINLGFDNAPIFHYDKIRVKESGKFNYVLSDGSLYSSIWSDIEYTLEPTDGISIITNNSNVYIIKDGIILNEYNPYKEGKDIKIDKYHLYCFDLTKVYNKNGYEIINADLDCFSSEMKIHKNIWGYDYGEYEMIYMVSNKDNKYNYLNMETSQFMLKEFIDQCPNVYDPNKQIIVGNKIILIKDFLK